MIASLILGMVLQAAGVVPAPAPVPWAVTTTAKDGHSAVSSSAWSTDDKARLVVRCDTASAKIVSIQFIPRGGFVAAQPRPVSFNVDGGGWLGTNWQFPGNGAFVRDDVVVTNLAVMIAHGKAIRVRATGPDDTAIDVTFAGPGEAPIRRVLDACGYAFGTTPVRTMAPAPTAKPAQAEDE